MCRVVSPCEPCQSVLSVLSSESRQDKKGEKWAVPPRHVGAMSAAEGFGTSSSPGHSQGKVVQAPPAMCLATSRCQDKHSRQQTKQQYTLPHTLPRNACQSKPQTRHRQVSTCAPEPLLGWRRAPLHVALQPLLAPSATHMHAATSGPKPCTAAIVARPCTAPATAAMPPPGSPPPPSPPPGPAPPTRGRAVSLWALDGPSLHGCGDWCGATLCNTLSLYCS